MKRVGDAARDTTLAEGLIKDSRGGIAAATPHDNYSERKPKEKERAAGRGCPEVRGFETLSRRLIKINNLEGRPSRIDDERRAATK